MKFSVDALGVATVYVGSSQYEVLTLGEKFGVTAFLDREVAEEEVRKAQSGNAELECGLVYHIPVDQLAEKAEQVQLFLGAAIDTFPSGESIESLGSWESSVLRTRMFGIYDIERDWLLSMESTPV